MPQQVPIDIKKTGSPPSVTFDPNPVDVVARDQIFWVNHDTVPHWPGLDNGDGTINNTFFMPNQIAGNGDQSATFSTQVVGTLNYACSLHPTEKGVINVKAAT